MTLLPLRDDCERAQSALLAFRKYAWYASIKVTWGTPMLCKDTDGKLEAFHIPEGVIDLARELYPIVQTIQKDHQGNGTIILPVTGGTIGSAEVELRKKIPFLKLIRLPWKRS